MKASISAALICAISGATERYAAYSPSYSPAVSYGVGYGNTGYGYGNGVNSYGGYGNGLNAYGGYVNGVGGYGSSYGGAGLNNGIGFGGAGNAYGLSNGYSAISPGPIKQVPIGLRKFGSPYKPANKACYGPWCESQRLEVENFEQTVIRDTENVWIVAYIDPACGECKKFAIEWERLRTVETIKYKRVKLGYVDITLEASRKVVGKYTAGKDVRATPTVFVYNDKNHPIEYKGDLGSSSLEEFVSEVCDTEDCSTKNYAPKHAVIGTHGGLQVLGATKIQNKSVLGKSNYSLEVKD